MCIKCSLRKSDKILIWIKAKISNSWYFLQKKHTKNYLPKIRIFFQIFNFAIFLWSFPFINNPRIWVSNHFKIFSKNFEFFEIRILGFVFQYLSKFQVHLYIFSFIFSLFRIFFKWAWVRLHYAHIQWTDQSDAFIFIHSYEQFQARVIHSNQPI